MMHLLIRADQGFPREGRMSTLKVGCQPIIRPNFPQELHCNEKTGPRGGRPKYIYVDKAGHNGQVVSMSDCYVGGLPIKSSILPLQKRHMREATSCHPGHQEVNRCHTTGESQGTYITYACQVRIRLPTLALKSREDTPEVQNKSISDPIQKVL